MLPQFRRPPCLGRPSFSWGWQASRLSSGSLGTLAQNSGKPSSPTALPPRPAGVRAVAGPASNVELPAEPALDDALAKPQDAAAIVSGPQANALRSAQQYINVTTFSREGLTNQLSSSSGEGYSHADAVAAVDGLDVDWKEQAAKSAGNTWTCKASPAMG